MPYLSRPESVETRQSQCSETFAVCAHCSSIKICHDVSKNELSMCQFLQNSQHMVARLFSKSTFTLPQKGQSDLRNTAIRNKRQLAIRTNAGSFIRLAGMTEHTFLRMIRPTSRLTWLNWPYHATSEKNLLKSKFNGSPKHSGFRASDNPQVTATHKCGFHVQAKRVDRCHDKRNRSANNLTRLKQLKKTCLQASSAAHVLSHCIRISCTVRTEWLDFVMSSSCFSCETKQCVHRDSCSFYIFFFSFASLQIQPSSCFILKFLACPIQMQMRSNKHFCYCTPEKHKQKQSRPLLLAS